jgi:hypothetical protein
MKDRKGKGYFKYLNYLFEDMYSVKSKFYPDSTFFKKDDKVILELEKSGTLWVLYSVWTSIADMFSLDYSETQQLIKEWVEAQLKQEEVAPSRASSMYGLRIAMVEEKLKSEEITPLDAGSNYLPFMEKQLKSEEVIPHTSITNQLMRVQEELKSVEIKPVKDVNLICQLAELRLNREEITPQESIPTQIWRDLEKEEVTPRSAIAPPFRWRNLDSVKYAEIKPNVPLSTYHLKVVEEKLKSEEIKPRQVVNGSFDWIQEQINLGEVTPTSFFVIK